MRLLFVLTISLAFTYGYPQYNQNVAASEDQLTAATNARNDRDDSDMYMEQQADETNHGEQFERSQSFYPSFTPFHNPPLGHSRPFYQQEGAYSHRPTAYQQHVGFDTSARFSGYKGDNLNVGGGGTGGAAVETHGGLLGSGNFGVIRGGTFYNDNDDENVESIDQFNSFLQNGHGRPASYYFNGNPRPRQYQQFENFRDFADINVPSNPAYSHYVIVYANRNGSKFEPEEQKNKPKNIMEHLALLDLETTTTEAAPVKKLSKSKRKLAKLAAEKKPWGKKSKTTTTPSTRDQYEPLLALS